MMKIEFLSPSGDMAGRYKVQFSDGTVSRFYRQTVEDFGLYSGMELSQEEYDALLDAAGKMSAKMRAIRIVSATSVSKQELQRRLIQKGEKPENAKSAVDWMESMTLLDDRNTAMQVVQRCISKGYGVARAKQALYEKRISKEFWEEALAEYPDQTDEIRDFLLNRLDATCDKKDVQRAIEALIRRGHSYGNIRRVLSQCNLDSQEFPEE